MNVVRKLARHEPDQDHQGGEPVGDRGRKRDRCPQRGLIRRPPQHVGPAQQSRTADLHEQRRLALGQVERVPQPVPGPSKQQEPRGEVETALARRTCRAWAAVI